MTNQTRPAEHSGVNPEKFKVTIARDPNIVKERAREMGEAQFEQNKRNSWLRRTFLYNRLPDFFRQKEIINARKKIESSGNIYADQTDDRAAYEAAIASTLQRLGSDYEDDFILREGETRRPANKTELLQIAHIISGYARGGKNKEWLEEQTTALLTTLYPDNKEEIFNNIIDVAKTIRESDIQYQSIDQLCALLDVTIANASTGISSEVHQSKVDRLVQTISERGIFKFVQADTAVLATAFALSAGSAVASGTTRSSLNVLLPMAGTALVGGTIGAMRQRTEFSRQLKQHQRDITLGKKRKNEEEHGVRAEMEKGEALFETKEAHGETGIIRTLERQLEAYSTSTPEHKATALSDMLDSLGDLLARQHIAQIGFVQTKDKQVVSPNALGVYRNEEGEIRKLTATELGQSTRVELISYSSLTEYSKEKDQLDLLKAKILTTLKRESQNTGPLRDVLSLAGKPMSEYLTELRNTHLIQLLAGNENSRGIQETVQNIDTLRKRATRNGALKGVIYGAAAGAVASIASQEIRALFDDKKIGTLETLTTRRPIDSRGKIFTFLEGLRRSAAGVKAESHTISLGVADSDAAIKFPDTVSIEKTGPGTFEVSNGMDSASNIHIDENGIVSEASKERLVTLGINIHEQKVPVSGSVRTESVSARDFLHNIVESAQNKYHAFAGHVKAIDRLYSKEDIVYKHGEKLSWAYRNNEFVAKLPLPKPDEKLRDGSDMYWNENVVTNHFRLLLQVSKDTPDKVIEVPVRINGGFIEAHIPADHPARALLETPNGFDGVFKGAQAELTYQSGTTHNGSMQTYETYYKEQYGDGPKELEELVQSSMPTKKTLLVFELNEHKANWPNSVLGATPARKTIDEAVNKNKTSAAVQSTRPTENEMTGETAETARSEFSLMTEADIPADTTEQDTVDLKLLLEKIKERLANRGYSKENLAELLHILNSVRDDGSTLESYEMDGGKMGIKITRPKKPKESSEQVDPGQEAEIPNNHNIFIAETNSSIVLNQEFITKQFTALQDLNLSPDLTNEGRNLILTINGWLATGANDGNSDHKIASDIRAWYAWFEKHTPRKTESTPEVEQPPTPSREEQFTSIRDALNEAYESVFDQIPEGTEKKILEINLSSLYQTNQETLPRLYLAAKAARQVLEKYVPEGTLRELPAENELFSEEFKMAREYLQQATNGTLETRITAAAPNADKAIADQMYSLHNKLKNLAKKQDQLNLHGIVKIVETSQHLENILSKVAQPVEEESQIQTQTTQEQTTPPPPAPPHRTASEYQADWEKRTQQKSPAAPVIEVNQISAQELAEFYSKQLPQLSKASLIKIESLPNGKDLLKQTDAHISQMLNHKDAFAHVSEIIATVDRSSRLLLKHDGHDAQFVWEVPLASKDFSVDKALGALNGTEILQDAGKFLNTSFETGIIARKDRAGSRIKNLSSAEKQTFTNLWVQWTSQKTAFETLARTAMDGITVSTAKDIATAAQTLEATTKQMEQLVQPRTVKDETQNASGNTQSNNSDASKEEKMQTYAKLSIILEKWQEEVAGPLGIKLSIAEADKNTEAVIKNIDIISKNLIIMRVYSKNLVDCAEVQISSQVSQLSWSTEKSRRTLLVPMNKEVRNDESFTFFYGSK